MEAVKLERALGQTKNNADKYIDILIKEESRNETHVFATLQISTINIFVQVCELHF